MNLRYLSTAPLLATALAIAGTSVGQATPTSDAGLGYRVQVVDKSAVVALGNGTFELAEDGGALAVKNGSGATIETWPLSYTLNGVRYPVRQEVSADRHMVRLTPMSPPHAATAQLESVASDQENATAQANFMNQLSISTSVGSIVGTIIGAILGGVVGAAVALASCTLLLACIVIGLPIFISLASAGGIVGTVIGGGGALVNAGWDYVQTMQAAPGTTHWRR